MQVTLQRFLIVLGRGLVLGDGCVEKKVKGEGGSSGEGFPVCLD